MRCFACNIELHSATEDKPTGRFYCSICMEPTNEVILALEDKKIQFYDNKDKTKFSIEGLSEIFDINVLEESWEISLEELEIDDENDFENSD